jgi:hypothetical protein
VLVIRTSIGGSSIAYEVEEAELLVGHLYGKQLIELHLAEHLWQRHSVQLVSIERMLPAC